MWVVAACSKLLLQGLLGVGRAQRGESLAFQVFILRVSRTQQVEGPRYLNTTAIFFSEDASIVVITGIRFKYQYQ